LTSVPTLALSVICSCAATAAASNNEAGRALVAEADAAPDSDDTAFMRPELTVDFSAWVADMVRK
jgi:hypothetical protein